MNWPTGPDYNDAIQNPQANLRDPCLRRGKVATNRLGLPVVDSGNFASVFQVSDGSQRWAVKCFTRQIRDQQERYNAISEDLKARCLPFTVEFDYQREGILVRGTWYPLLRMQWVEGQMLDAYVQSQLSNSQALQKLAERWVAVVGSLRSAGIAHGDLQLGNVKIVNGEVRLIDYDGMYVPALKGKESTEAGHQNFQHPHRSGRDFDGYIDHYPAWVIYTSLLALSEYPSIWGEAKGGEDCLIFRKKDFVSPGASPVFTKLRQVGSPRLRALLLQLEDFSGRQPRQGPALEGVPAPSPTPGGGWLPKPPVPAPAPGPLPDWMKDHAIPAPAGHETVLSEPLGDALQGKELVVTRRIFWAAGTLMVVGVLGSMDLGVSLAWIASVFAGAVLLVEFQYESFQRRLANPEIEHEITTAERRATEIESQKRSLDKSYDESTRRVKEAEIAVSEYAAVLAKESALWTRRLVDVRSALPLALKNADLLSSQALLKKQEEVQRQKDSLSQRIAICETLRVARGNLLLKEMRSSHVDGVLRDRDLSDVCFEGLGATLLSRLKAAGFCTAFDVLAGNVRTVNGIGTGRAYALERWARELREGAETAAPKHLPHKVLEELAAECGSQTQGLEEQKEALDRELGQFSSHLEQSLARERSNLMQRYQGEEAGIERAHALWRQDSTKRASELEAGLTHRRELCVRNAATLGEERERLLREEKELRKRLENKRIQRDAFKKLTFGRFVQSAWKRV
jgi:hypothetical protein